MSNDDRSTIQIAYENGEVNIPEKYRRIIYMTDIGLIEYFSNLKNFKSMNNKDSEMLNIILSIHPDFLIQVVSANPNYLHYVNNPDVALCLHAIDCLFDDAIDGIMRCPHFLSSLRIVDSPNMIVSIKSLLVKQEIIDELSGNYKLLKILKGLTKNLKPLHQAYLDHNFDQAINEMVDSWNKKKIENLAAITSLCRPGPLQKLFP